VGHLPGFQPSCSSRITQPGPLGRAGMGTGRWP
jgi:hypothetical protein